MTRKELLNKYFDFFKKKGHEVIPSAPLIPENDPSVLFTTAGMHPLVPYLLGEIHPKGRRLVDVQLCLRTGDIDEVGDTFHHTFFEMLGNWSLGDPASTDGVGENGYWKKESITWSLEFLLDELKLSKDRIWVTVFAGDKDAAKDTESADVWKSLGIADSRIYYLPKEDNWWGPAGSTGPCGPDSEIFYDVTGVPCGDSCRPGDNCGRFFEIWNNVFMQYNKTENGKYEELSQKNVDTGMGVERTVAVLNGYDDNYEIPDIWGEIIKKIETISGYKYEEKTREMRIIADHTRASVFVLAEGIEPGNKEHGYVLRRLIRRALRFGKTLGIKEKFMANLAEGVIDVFGEDYSLIRDKQDEIIKALTAEEEKFTKTLDKGLREIEKIEKLTGKTAFYLYETYGFPLELSEEIAKDRGQTVDAEIFEKEFENHKNLSRTASGGKFKGGLADASYEVMALHTTTHLLHKALRLVLGEHVSQKGSNITKDRLRFDFSHNEKLSQEEIENVERIINEQVQNSLPVTFEVKSFTEAKKEGALAFFGDRYPDEVKVYTIGDPKGEWYSKEVCGGPHVANTSEIGHVRIIKQEKIGTNLIRIYAAIEPA